MDVNVVVGTAVRVGEAVRVGMGEEVRVDVRPWLYKGVLVEDGVAAGEIGRSHV